MISQFLEFVSSLDLLARGAESELRKGHYYGVPAVYKLRRRKEYMDPSLDSDLRRARTLKEAKVLSVASRANIPVPLLLAVYPSIGLLVMQYIEGERLKEALDRGVSGHCDLARRAGAILGMLHEHGISHGDPTTSNYIITDSGDLYIIDFGLADFTSEIEDLAVDIHLFRRAVSSSHARLAEDLARCFIEGYSSVRGEKARPVIERAEEIMLRGRYVEERRTVWKP